MIWLVALGLAALEIRVTCRNMNAIYNGMGAIDSVWERTAQAPMRYRVLVPWMVGWLHGKERTIAYLAIKMALLALTLAGTWAYLGESGALAFAALLASTMEFDYWDQYAELLGVLGCMSGNPWLTALGALAWGLSRETAVMAPAVSYLACGNLYGAVGPLALAIVRLTQGETTLYCPRWMWCYNVEDLRKAIGHLDYAPLYSLLWSVVCVGILWPTLPRPFLATRALPLAWLGAGWILARARETRVFLPTALWMAASVVR